MYRTSRPLTILLTFSLLCVGCLEPGVPVADTPQVEGVIFSRPQALLFVDGILVVASTSYGQGPDGWGEGWLTAVDPRGGQIWARVPTSARNPQRLRRYGDSLLALSTGAYDFSDFDQPRAMEPGAIDTFQVAGLRSGQPPIRSVTIEPAAGGTIGAPIDFALSGGRALIASGIANRAFLYDADARRLLRGADAPLGYDGARRLALGSVASYAGGFLVADFNTDRLFVFDEDGAVWPCAVELGDAPGEVEGAQSLVVDGDEAFVLLALSGVVRRIPLTGLSPIAAGCGVVAETLAGPLGQAPNDLHVRGGRLYVVESAENQVVAYARDSGEVLSRFALPRGSNPWHAAFSEDGALMAVSEWATDGVTIFDLLTGQSWRLGTMSPLATEPPMEGLAGGVLADEVVAASGQPEAAARATNGVRGGGAHAGSTDVYSFGQSADDVLVLGWGGRRALDGPGPDLVVFENAFDYGGGHFMDLVVVEVSPDGERWVAFPHDYLAADETIYSPFPEDWPGFAGRTPVGLNADESPMAPFAAEAGGDRFDLADLPGALGAEVRAEGFGLIRLSAAAGHLNPDTGALFVRDPASNGPDIDGVVARYFD